MSANSCAVCGCRNLQVIFQKTAPSITSMSSVLDCETQVFLCEKCLHVQTLSTHDTAKFYDEEYKISLQSDDHDQLYEMVGKKAVYRTEFQADLLLSSINIAQGARLLDYGAAKAGTLKRVIEKRKDIQPAVFDVSKDYQPFWEGWVMRENQAIYSTPESWNGRFDVVSCHFVLEHIDAPIACLKHIHELLKNGGQLFLSVPNLLENTGDLIVVDHVNHFSKESLKHAMQISGFTDVKIDSVSYRAGLVVSARKSTKLIDQLPIITEQSIQDLKELGGHWQQILNSLEVKLANAFSGQTAIYGAGFYGSVIANQIEGNFICFLDNNPHLKGTTHFGKPILHPSQLPSDITRIFVGLNPAIARRIVGEYASQIPSNVDVIYLAENEF